MSSQYALTWLNCLHVPPQTRMQAQPLGSQVGVLHIFSSIFAVERWRGFYRGFAPCLLRAAPANAVAFWGVSVVKSTFG